MTSLTSQPVLVSIVMPLYNAERYVFAALQSILRERSISLEVIVVNDGSTDHSLREVYRLKDNRIRVVQNTGKGIAAALNTGLAAAQGSIFMRCDADDLYPMHRFAQQIHWLQNHPEIVAVCGNYEAIDSRGTSIIQFWCGTEAEDISVELRNGISRTHLCTFAVRTEVLRQLGGFRSYFVTAEDIDMQLRIAEVGQVWYLPDVSYRYRIHDSSITHTKSSSEREFFDFVVREFQRQRQDTGEDDLQRGCPPTPPQRHEKSRFTASQHIQGFLLGKAWQEFRAGQKWQGLMTGMRSALVLPSNVSVWQSVLAMGVKSMTSLAPFSSELSLSRLIAKD